MGIAKVKAGVEWDLELDSLFLSSVVNVKCVQRYKIKEDFQ